MRLLLLSSALFVGLAASCSSPSTPDGSSSGSTSSGGADASTSSSSSSSSSTSSGGADGGSSGTPGTVLASEIQIYNPGDTGRKQPLTGNYTLTYEDGPPSQGPLRPTDPRDATDRIIIQRDFKRVGEKVTIDVPGGLKRTCTVAAAAKDLTYLSLYLQFDPNNPSPGSPPANEIICLCGFDENVAPGSCSK
ncbi:MAG: hypothetical protein KC657_08285 [Myxococcales bacterium]|nr:hypothetical protein [Myxococcales bacterium]